MRIFFLTFFYLLDSMYFFLDYLLLIAVLEFLFGKNYFPTKMVYQSKILKRRGIKISAIQMVIEKKDLDFFKEYTTESSSIIPLLQQIQDKFGYLPSETLGELADYLNVPLSRIYGVATFYSQFNFTPLGKYVVKVCHGTACHVNGAVDIADELIDIFGIKEEETTSDGLITLQSVACLGCCSLAPVVSVNDKVYGNLTRADVRRIAKKIVKDEFE